MDRRSTSFDDYPTTHALENAVFYFPRMSTSSLKNFVAFNNSGYLVSVDEGSLTISEDSRFLGNTGVVGAVIVASRSNISISGAQFGHNSYRNAGGCLDLRDGSSAVINSTVFISNVAYVASAILATSLQRLDIRDSHFEQNCRNCGGYILVNHSVDATSAITISNSHLGSFVEFDMRMGDYPQGLLVIDRFHNGHVLLESIDFGRQLSSGCVLGDKGDRIGMVVLVDTHNVSFTSWNSSYTRASGALGSGLRFVDSSGWFRIEQALFHEINCCDVGYAIFLRTNPCDNIPSKLSVIDSEFSSNRFLGGTVFVTGNNVDVEVRRSQFIDNYASTSRSYNFPAAAPILYVSDINSLHVSNCTARNNIASNDEDTGSVLGSLHIDRTKHAKIEGSSFVASSVGTKKGHIGGAVYCSSGGKESGLEVTDCEFEDNIAAGGGAIYANDLGQFDMIGCSFRNNSAVTSGGAILAIDGYGIVTSRKTTFADNKARIGGAMALGNKLGSQIEGCTFSGNAADLYGGAVAFMNIPTDATLTMNSLFSFNISSVAFLRNAAAFGGESSLVIFLSTADFQNFLFRCSLLRDFVCGRFFRRVRW